MLTVVTAMAVTVSVAFTVYFLLWNLSQLLMTPFAALYVWRHQRMHTPRARAVVGQIAAQPMVSIVVPAFNEELTIVESVRALLALDYESREIVVVNDGSSDGTFAALFRAFQLTAAPLAFDQPIKTAAVQGVYRSITEPELVVVDKVNAASKSDASNAGINAAAGELVLIIDADTVLEPDALSRAVVPFLEDAATVAVGANIALTNGCRVEHGRITHVALPRSWFARFQVVEYMRSFLLFRLACAGANAVVLISGAFGLFRRDALIAVGGFDRTAIGEDMDLTVRLQEQFRALCQPIRIVFDPNPLGWTQAPEDWRSLRGQRWRWRRGLLQVLWRHRHMIGNRRYGAVSLGALPYILLFEGAAPLIEVGGLFLSLTAASLGLLDWRYVAVVIATSALLGVAVTLSAVLLSDIATARYMRGRELGLLLVVAILESFGYRQLNSWWGCVGTVRALTGRGGWGAMTRRAFES